MTYRVDTGIVDVGGPGRRTPRVSLVVDDAAEPVGPGGQRGRGLEIRGEVEIVHVDVPQQRGFSGEVLRIHPRRIVVDHDRSVCLDSA